MQLSITTAQQVLRIFSLFVCLFVFRTGLPLLRELVR